MNKTFYAPVLITTLNRDKHFIKGIESLKKNTWAEYTDVYVALDYPPCDKYEEGYKKICVYLEQSDFSMFHSFHVVKREKNYGARSNLRALRDSIMDTYDRWIVAEDDIEFAHTFIEYMDKCLEKYKDDDRVMAINGYSYPLPWKVEEGSNAFLQFATFSAWGVGYWKSKIIQVRERIYNSYLLNNFERAYKNGLLEHMIDGRRYEYIAFALADVGSKMLNVPCDMSYGIYMTLADKCVVTPVISQTRNHGFDGSGLYCANITDFSGEHSQKYNYSEQPLYDKDEIDLVVDESVDAQLSAREMLNDFLYVPVRIKRISNISMCMYKVLGKYYFTLIKKPGVKLKKYLKKIRYK